MTPDEKQQQLRDAVPDAVRKHDEQCRSQDYHTDGDELHASPDCPYITAALDAYVEFVRAVEKRNTLQTVWNELIYDNRYNIAGERDKAQAALDALLMEG